jgi:hypothetical protein
VNRQHLLPVGEVEVDDRPDDLDAGIADQDVDPAVSRHGVGDTLLHGGLIRDVHGDRKGIRALCLDLSCRRIRGIEIKIGDNWNAALFGEAQGDLLADATGRASDHCDFSVKTRHVSFLQADERWPPTQASFR